MVNSQRPIRHAFVKLKGLDASKLLDFEPHNLGLTTISIAPSMEIVEGLILSIFMLPNFSFSFMDVVK